MKIAVCSDEVYPVHQFVVEELKKYGHDAVLFGALKTKKTISWVRAAEEAAESIIKGTCKEGIFFCWTGTGISMAANKLANVRAALCVDAETAKGARIWNHANVLALSNRLLSNDVAREILKAWFETSCGTKGKKGIQDLNKLDNKFRKK